MQRYITELANDIAKSCPDLVENGCGNDNCVACLAFKLIGMGYKKQTDTADVVPKSECAECAEKTRNTIVKLQGIINRLKKYDEQRDIELHARLIAETREKVAREIFEEIENCMKYFEDYDDGYLLKKCEFEFFMRELKKKYAEGE